MPERTSRKADAAILAGVGDLDQLAGGGGGISEVARLDELHAAALSSLSTPRATIFNASSGSGRCSAFASSHGARIQTSRSSSVVKITGIAFEWIGSTTVFGAWSAKQ
jgi:hypothetical protein